MDQHSSSCCCCSVHPTSPTRSPALLPPPQLFALLQLTRQPWYQRFDPHPEGTNCFDRRQANSAVCSRSHENSTVFLMSLGQYLVAALVFNKGPPFRKPIYTNPWLLLGAGAVAVWCGVIVRMGIRAWYSHFLPFLPPIHGPALPPPECMPAAALSFQTLFVALLLFAPAGPVSQEFAGLVAFPTDFRAQLCLLLLANLAVAWLGDALAGWAYETRLKGRRILGRWTVT